MQLHVRLVGSFESALVNQKGYDAISGASTNVTQNKNSDASVEVALIKKGQDPQSGDWKLLSESDIRVISKGSSVNIANRTDPAKFPPRCKCGTAGYCLLPSVPARR